MGAGARGDNDTKKAEAALGWAPRAHAVRAHPCTSDRRMSLATGTPGTSRATSVPQAHNAPGPISGYGTSGFFPSCFAFTSATASSMAVSRTAIAGWFAVCPFATLTGVAAVKRFQNPATPSMS